MRKNLFFRAFVLVVCAINANAESILDIYKLAQKNDSSYQVNLAKHRATLEKKSQAFSYLLPSLSISISKRNLDTSATKINTDSVTLKLEQTIYNKATLHSLRQVEYLIDSSESSLKESKFNLMIKVVKTYFNVLLAQDMLSTNQQELKTIDRQLKDIKQRFEVGLIAVTDLTEAKAKKDLATSKVLSAETQLIIAQQKLEEITNQKLSALKPLIKHIPLKAPLANVGTMIETALKNNQTIQIKWLASEFARENISIQRSSHYPSVKFVADFGESNVSGSSIVNGKNNSMELSLKIPLFSGGLVSAKVTEAQYNFIAAQKDLVLAQRQIKSQISELYFTVISNSQQIKATENLLKSSLDALNAVKLGFDAGTRTTTDVLNARSQMFKYQLDLAKLKYNYLINKLTLKQVAGVLNVQDLISIDNLLAK